MNVTRKDATITNTDEDFPGSFEVVLSTPAQDRDGDSLAAEDWKSPLPDHITFDMDHGMSVEKTVGSGVPSIEDGKLIVRGTYSSLDRAQEVRTLVKEGHIRTTSVAFMSEKTTKAGKSRTVRELLNGAFVAIPSNREAVILGAKAGARNSKMDQANIQTAHDALVAAGADCGPDMSSDAAEQPQRPAGPSDDTGAEEGSVGGKAVSLKGKYSAEQLRQMLAKGEAMKAPDGTPSYPIGDLADLSNAIHAVGRGGADHDAIRAYIIRRAKALGASDQIPDGWGADGSMKSYTGKPGHDPASLAQGVDAALDEALALLKDIDQTTLPEPVAQALGLVNSAAMTVDELLHAMGVDDPDDDKSDDDEPDAAKSQEMDAITLKNRAIQLAALAG